MSNQPTLEPEDFEVEVRRPGRAMGPEIKMALDNPGRWVRTSYARYSSLTGSISRRKAMHNEMWQITRDKPAGLCWIRFDGVKR